MIRIRYFCARVLLIGLLILISCFQLVAKPITGRASFYGRKHIGHRMANGQRFDARRLTAAHRTLPLGTWIRIMSWRTKRWVRVQITDRGPYYGRRALDLSPAAAKPLGVRAYGVINVVYEVESDVH